MTPKQAELIQRAERLKQQMIAMDAGPQVTNKGHPLGMRALKTPSFGAGKRFGKLTYDGVEAYNAGLRNLDAGAFGPGMYDVQTLRDGARPWCAPPTFVLLSRALPHARAAFARPRWCVRPCALAHWGLPPPAAPTTSSPPAPTTSSPPTPIRLRSNSAPGGTLARGLKPSFGSTSKRFPDQTSHEGSRQLYCAPLR